MISPVRSVMYIIMYHCWIVDFRILVKSNQDNVGLCMVIGWTTPRIMLRSIAGAISNSESRRMTSVAILYKRS